MARKAKQVEQEFVVTTDTVQGAGAVTFWSLSGDLDLTRLTTEWKRLALPEEWLLETPSEEVAFRRAVKTMEDGDLYIQSVKQTGEAALMVTVVDNDLPAGVCLAKWKLNKVKRPEQTFALDADMAALAPAIQHAFDKELSRITTNDVSSWLKSMALGQLVGLTLRESGGFYYIPPAHLPVWERVIEAVEAASAHKVYSLPTMHSASAVRTILDAALSEASTTIANLQSALEAHADGSKPKGADALDTLAHKAAAMKAQMASYAKFLGVTMPQVETQLDTLKSNLFQASAVAAKAKDEARRK